MGENQRNEEISASECARTEATMPAVTNAPLTRQIEAGEDGRQRHGRPAARSGSGKQETKRVEIVLRVEPAAAKAGDGGQRAEDGVQRAEGGKSKITNDPIPARMLNEFVYCQRLFYYEFVEGVFVESADTLRGGAIHVRVDSRNGGMPSSKGKSDNA